MRSPPLEQCGHGHGGEQGRVLVLLLVVLAPPAHGAALEVHVRPAAPYRAYPVPGLVGHHPRQSRVTEGGHERYYPLECEAGLRVPVEAVYFYGDEVGLKRDGYTRAPEC